MSRNFLMPTNINCESIKEICAPFVFYSIEAMRNSAVLFTLIGKFVHAASCVDRYDITPSESTKKTYLGLIALALASAAGTSASIINYRHRAHYPAMQDVFATPLLGVYFFYFLDLIMNTGQIAISLPIFLFTCSLGVLSTILLLSKFKTGDSSNQIICTLKDLDALNLQPNHTASTLARRLNAFRAAYYGASAMITFEWALKREVMRETTPLDPWMLQLTGMMLIPTLFIGNQLAAHPKFFQGFAASAKGVRDAALIYAAFSGLFQLLEIYVWCDNKTLCLESDTLIFLSYMSVLMSLALGFFSAATTKFNFEKNTQKNVAAENAMYSTMSLFYRASDGCMDSSRRAVVAVSAGCQSMSDLFKAARENISACCKRNESESGVREPLMEV